MKWFKHISKSHDDRKLSSVVDILGLEGYGFWWMMLEIVAEQVDNDNCTIIFPCKKFAKLFGFSEKKFLKFVKVFESFELFSIKFLENNQNEIMVSVPNLLKYRDEYTDKKSKKSEQCRDKVPLKIKDIDIDKDISISPISPLSKEGTAERDFLVSENSEQAEQIARQDTHEQSSEQSTHLQEQEAFARTRIEPDGFFKQIRAKYNELGRNEGDLVGWHEYQAHRKDKSKPDNIALIEDFEARSQTRQWQDGFAPSLARYLREELWKVPIEELNRTEKHDKGYKNKQLTGQELFEKNAETARRVIEMREKRRQQENAEETSGYAENYSYNAIM